MLPLCRSKQDFEAKSKRGDGMGGRKEVRAARLPPPQRRPQAAVCCRSFAQQLGTMIHLPACMRWINAQECPRTVNGEICSEPVFCRLPSV